MVEKISKLTKRDKIKKWFWRFRVFRKYKYIWKYLRKLFKLWLSEDNKIFNPLEIPWVLLLFKNRLSDLDKSLMNVEKILGENNLKLIFDELLDENSDENNLFRKIKSLEGEINAFIYLKNEFENLKKINSIGDFECDGKNISVKSILDLDLNHQMILNVIRALAYVEENKILRKFNKVRLEKLEKIDYIFLNNILWFLRNNLIECLNFIDNSDVWDEAEIKTVRYFRNKKTNGFLEVLASKYKKNRKNRIEIVIREDREGEDKLEHSIRIKFLNLDSINEKYFCYSCDIDAGFVSEEFDKEQKKKIEKILSEKMNEVDKHADSEKYILWINLSICSFDEIKVKQNFEEIENIFDNLTQERKYVIYLCCIPQWGFDMKENKIIYYDKRRKNNIKEGYKE